MIKRGIKKNKGLAIATVLLVLVVILVIGFAAATIASRNLSFVNKDKHNRRAFYSAEAGVARGLSKLKENPDWDGYETDANGVKTQTFKEVKMSNSDDTYTVLVFNNSMETAKEDIEGFRGTKVPPGNCYLVGEGKVGSDKSEKAVKYVGLMCKRTNPFEFGGIVSKEKTSFTGSQVDVWAYDSATGQKVSNRDISGVLDNGADDFVLTGNGSRIHGNVYAGPGSKDDTFKIHSKENVDGQIKILPDRFPMPEVTLPELPAREFPSAKKDPEVVLDPGSYDELKVTTQTIVLKGPGDYIFKGITISGNAEIKADTTNGPVKVYLDGNMKITGSSTTGGFHNSKAVGDSNPTDLLIFGTPNCEEIHLTGNADCYFGVYAPDTYIKASGHGNDVYYGALIGKEIDYSASAFAYDIALSRLFLDEVIFTELSWQRY